MNIDNQVNVSDFQDVLTLIASSPLAENHNDKYGSPSPFSKSPWTMQMPPPAYSNENEDDSTINGDVTYNH